MSDELFERFRKTAADSLSKPVDEVTLESSFADDLDADSLDLVQMVMDLEEEFDITVEEEELEGITTVSGDQYVDTISPDAVQSIWRAGKLLWQKDLGTLDGNFFMVPAAQWGYASSPILREGKIIIQADVKSDSFLAAFDVPDYHRSISRAARNRTPIGREG